MAASREAGAARIPEPPDERYKGTLIARGLTKSYKGRQVVAGVSLGVRAGEAVGLIGPNASGKTTLLRVVAGVTRPDLGSVSVAGRTLSLLELGSGFHADLTGRENLRVLGRLMGVPAGRLGSHVDEAVEFAAMEEAVDHRLKTYSTGMVARLGLAMALVAPAELLLIDEVLAVGDEEFRRRAIARLAERTREGLAVLFVSHDLQLVEQVCGRVLRLDEGRCVDDGPVDEVIGAYAGSSWAGGVHDAEGGIRLQRLVVDRRQVPAGGRIGVEGVLVVDEAQPDARLELALRSPPHDREAALSLDEREAMSAVIETVIAPGAELARAGRYRFRCSIEVGKLVGEIDLVVAAIDQHRQLALAEVWEQIVVGNPEPGSRVTFAPGMRWDVAPVDG